MLNPNNIPHLIKLLDDDSPEVQNRVVQELASFGPNLKRELNNLSLRLNSQQKSFINAILKDQKRFWLKQTWSSWFYVNSEEVKLERALGMLAEYLEDNRKASQITDMLDVLAAEYQEKYPRKDVQLLAQFLFKDKGFKGNEKDYYNPQNSNLLYVLKKKKGIPISLTSVYMLVGWRLGLKIEGCHFPGHFLARIYIDGEKAFVDCFSGGQIIEEDDMSRVRTEVLEGIEEILNEKADAQTVIKRYLANLIRAFQIQDNEHEADLMVSLFKQLDDSFMLDNVEEITPEAIIGESETFFQAGQVVKHLRYGYRGIIVDTDMVCQATDDWYYGNQTQPNRNQPWYHVLVDGSDSVTYVAQSNLTADASENKIEHPLLTYFFTQSDAGEYVRNDNPWPDTDF